MNNRDFDVCFLGSRYGQGDDFSRTYTWKNGEAAHEAAFRDEVVFKMKEAFGSRFGLFGKGWGKDVTEVPLDRAHEVYWRSKIGLNVSLSNQLKAYSSDRLFRILGCGSLLLTKRFPMMGALGLRNQENCLTFDTADDAVAQAKAWVLEPERLQEVAMAGAKLVHDQHTWKVRMLELQPYIDAVRETK